MHVPELVSRGRRNCGRFRGVTGGIARTLGWQFTQWVARQTTIGTAMDTLAEQVRQARRRLTLQRFLAAAPWCLFVALVVAAVAVAVDKYRPLVGQPWHWLAGGAAAGVLTAAVWALWKRDTPLAAALEVDRRFGLKERLSSALALSAKDRETAAGQALLADALRRAGGLDVGERFTLQAGRWAWLPIAPTAAALLVMLLVTPAAKKTQAKSAADADVKKQVQKSTAALQKKLAERRKQAEEEGLKEAENLLERLERGTQELARTTEADRKQTLMKLNDLAKDLEKRREQLGGAEKLQQQLNQLRSLERGPADEFAKSLRQGDFAKAKRELEELRKKLAENKLDDAAQKELAQQLEAMQDKLNKLAESHQQAMDELAKQIAEKQQQGQTAEAQDLQRKLDALRQQTGQSELLKQMASKLGQAAQNMRDGKHDEALAQMQQMQSELSQLDSQAAESEMLEAALDEIAAAKDSMNCKECDGEGCQACAGGRNGKRSRRDGQGMGAGRGQGDRPEAKTDDGFYDAKTKQKLTRGTAVITDTVEGPNIRGAVQEQVNQQFEEAQAVPADPLTDQPLARPQREHARRYFEALREGK